MSDWDRYAVDQPITKESIESEPTQALRIERVLDRCVGSVLDVGGGDGYLAGLLIDRGHPVLMVESSFIRCERARLLGIDADFGEDLRGYETGSFDTVLLGEVLEHLEDPGLLLRDAFRIARERVIVTVPLLGWADPTHRWRISLDHVVTPDPRESRPATSEQIVLTWERGECWPVRYWETDEKWRQQFVEGR